MAESPLEQHGQAEPAHTVLHVEHDLAHLDLVRGLLDRWPRVRAIAAMQGRLGLELALQHQPALVLLDLHLPDLPGLEVLRHLRTDHRTQHIPVITLGSPSTAPLADRLIRAGARAHATKPLDTHRLLGLIGDVLA